jgi:hypothetical protein
MTDESLSIITCSCIDIAVIDARRRIYIEIMMISCIKSSQFQYLQGIEIFAVSADDAIMIPVTAFHKHSSDIDSLFAILRNQIQLLYTVCISYRIGSFHDIISSTTIIAIPKLQSIFSEKLHSRLRTASTV